MSAIDDRQGGTMKVLVATHVSQGTEANDYCWTLDGELVTPLVLGCSDEACGCNRGFPGLGSSRATTTAMVADLPHVGPAELEEAVTGFLDRGGWLAPLPQEDRDDLVTAHVSAIRLACVEYAVGTVVGRIGERMYERRNRLAA
jgi:hypothetical protein